MKVKEIQSNLTELTAQCNEIIDDLKETRRKVAIFRSNFKYDSNIVTILDSYVLPYIDGLLGGGQIMMSLEDIYEQLGEASVDTYIIMQEESDDYEILDEREVFPWLR